MLFDQWVTRVLQSDDVHTAFSVLDAAVREYGYTSLVFSLLTDHASMNLPKHHGFASTYPEDFVVHYNAAQYNLHDPVWGMLLKRRTVFSWEDAVDAYARNPALSDADKTRAAKVMSDAREAGLHSGLAVSFMNRFGETSGIGLSTHHADADQSAEARAQIFLLSSLFQERYYAAQQERQNVGFSDRERDVLVWAADGKSDGEIAEILGLSLHTVRYHWRRVFDRLGVQNKTGAVARAILLGLITPTFTQRR